MTALCAQPDQYPKPPGFPVLCPMGIPIFGMAGCAQAGDLDLPDAAILQGQAVGCPQVKLYRAIAGRQERFSLRAEGLPHLLHHLGADLVMVRGDGRPNPGQEFFRTAAISGLHRLNCGLDDLANGAQPAGMS